MGTSTAYAINSKELIDWQLALIDQLSSYTLAYIGFAIAILLALGGIFYLYTLKPFEKELQRQAGEIRDAKNTSKEALEQKFESLKSEIEERSSFIKTETETALATSLEDIRLTVATETSLEIAKTKEDLIKEVRDLQEKISELKLKQATQDKDLEVLKGSRTKDVEEDKKIDIRIRTLETYMYFKEKKMGSITIPLKTIKDLIGSKDEWRLTRWLQQLKEGITGFVVTADTKVDVVDTISKLPAKYKVLGDEILKIVNSSGENNA